jgi:thioredoxin-like negative regulator of GroEL
MFKPFSMRASAAAAALAALSVPACEKGKALLGKIQAAKEETGTEGAAKHPADIRKLGEPGFASFTQTKDRLMVVHFHATWCPHSNQLVTMLDQIAGEYSGQSSIGRVDSDQEVRLIDREKVHAYPRLRFYRDGKLLEEVEGVPASPDDLRETFGKHAKGVPVSYPQEKAAAEPTIQPMKKDWLPPGIERR